METIEAFSIYRIIVNAISTFIQKSIIDYTGNEYNLMDYVNSEKQHGL